MRRTTTIGALAVGTLLLSGCVYNDYGCFAEADLEPSDVSLEANAFLASLDDDDDGREREYTRKSSRRSSGTYGRNGNRNGRYNRDGYYGDRRRPYGC